MLRLNTVPRALLNVRLLALPVPPGLPSIVIYLAFDKFTVGLVVLPPPILIKPDPLRGLNVRLLACDIQGMPPNNMGNVSDEGV